MPPPLRKSLTPVVLWVLLCTILNAGGWLLSALGRLDATGYGCLIALIAPCLMFWYRRSGAHFRSGFRFRRFKRTFPLAFATIAILAIAGGILHAPANYDALAYRTPRVLHWLADGQWHWIHTDFHRLNTRGSGFEWLTAPLILFTGSDRFFFVINAISFLLLPGLCFRVMTGLGVRTKVAWYWMWILPTGYCYILQAGSIGNDLYGATLAFAAMDFALRAVRERSATSAWLAILSAAVMTAAKGFNLLLLLPWGLAMLPTTLLLLRRPLPTLMVGLLALWVSLVPSSLLNHKHCGDWQGLSVEPIHMGTGAPLFHLGVNGAMIALHNFNPTFFVFSEAWKRWLSEEIPPVWQDKLRTHFEGNGIPFKLPEMHMEEGAGLGFGVSLLLAAILLGQHPSRRPRTGNMLAGLTAPRNLIPAGALVAVVYFFSQSGLGCPARYLAPFYLFLIAPVLRLQRAYILIHRDWWRRLAYLGFILAALLVIATPPRPLWPAQTLLRAIHADTTQSPFLKRIWTVYSVYGARPDAFAPMKAKLPPHLETLGLVTFDDPETSLWKPFGSRRIMHITRADDAKSLREKGIEYVLVSEYIVNSHQRMKIEEWLARHDAEIVESFNLPLRATRGATTWHLVKIRPTGQTPVFSTP